MAKKEFIFQGFTAKTHTAAILRLFDVVDIQRAIVSVAFVSQSGVDLLAARLAPHGARTKAFIGIRNDITSTQGAKALLSAGASLFVVDTGSRNLLFHPKLYLVKGKKEARLMIGSANLTLGGLNNNIEAGVAIDLDLTDPQEKALVDGIEAEFDALVAAYPDNVLPITTNAQLDTLQASGRLIDETVASPPRPISAATSPAGDVVPRIKLKVLPLRKLLAAAKKAVKPAVKVAIPAPPAKKAAAAAKKIAAAAPAVVPAPAAAGIQYQLVWESKPLTERDLNVPTGKNTHPTGSINLDKGLLPVAVDHRHFFRDIVFSALAWSPTARPTMEEAYGKFQLVLKGISYGEFDLRIGHSTAVGTYAQNNAMTRLSWGPMRGHIARPDLIGRTLALYRDLADPKRYLLEID